ncbi:FMN-binding protein [Prosthecobacter dejongeii]|uniref:Na+-translocating ferredoxin:NAD+ oxidoreductase RnfG subunit n=1 Tax=Prosthecobacter dejongeii TaxID=48465 RepID=A0A7W8DRD3_9BACT|nr:FMN-binding protein [Prosthecobacter dejongeii]MBB5038811.1 Na+-translocating ferredoxin:NAD+ oxidoreductase RnfG subunit [Prosthecobacter dejongeii]
MASSHLRPHLIRLWRIGLLVLAVLVIRQAVEQQDRDVAVAALKPERLRDFFPEAATLSEAPSSSGWRQVLDATQKPLGFVTTTAPESDHIIGYSGPTTTLLAFDLKKKLIGLRVLKSHDTSDHLAEVIADRKFFKQFTDRREEGAAPALHTVTGATLTSTAIAQGVMTKMGQTAAISLRFPEDITLAEVHTLLPTADALRPVPRNPGRHEVLDAGGQVIALAVRTSPVTDTLVGYKGPTDTLMLLDASGEVLKKIALRRSYDTKRYVAYVTGDAYFLNLFNDRPLEALAEMDFEKEKIEGVSGATETSWSMAEGLKRRAQSLLEERPTGWLRRMQWRWQDGGHGVIILAAFVMAFTRLRGRAWARHTHHFLLMIYGGFIAGELLSQGLLVGWAAHGTPWRSAPGLLLLGVVALLGPVFTSKQLYCHHICPHGALQQLLARRLPWQWRIPARLEAVLTRLPFLLLAFVLLSVVVGWGVDLNDLEPFDAYVFRVAGGASIAIALVGLAASLFTPLAYCKYGCPTGAVFKLLRFTGDADRLGLRDWLAMGFLALLAFL